MCREGRWLIHKVLLEGPCVFDCQEKHQQQALELWLDVKHQAHIKQMWKKFFCSGRVSNRGILWVLFIVWKYPVPCTIWLQDPFSQIWNILFQGLCIILRFQFTVDMTIHECCNERHDLNCNDMKSLEERQAWSQIRSWWSPIPEYCYCTQSLTLSPQLPESHRRLFLLITCKIWKVREMCSLCLSRNKLVVPVLVMYHQYKIHQQYKIIYIGYIKNAHMTDLYKELQPTAWFYMHNSRGQKNDFHSQIANLYLQSTDT